MIRRPPRSTRHGTLFPYSPRFRSELSRVGLRNQPDGPREVLCTGLVMQGFGSLEQHLEGELTSPDMLDAHADQLLVVRNHHRLDRFQDLLGALLGQRNVPFDQLGLEPLQQCPVSRLRRSEEHTSELQSLMRIPYAVS